jgi:uncharacterized protein (TIGR00725 family)
MKNKIIGVIGASNANEYEQKIAYEVGKIIAEKNAILICGGLSGVMEYACRGAKEKNGITIGILPGTSKSEANKYVDIPIATGIGEARNIIIVHSSDGIIAIGGGYGTLSELAFALRHNIPIVGISTWDVTDPYGKIIEIKRTNDPKEAVEYIFSLIT